MERERLAEETSHQAKEHAELREELFYARKAIGEYQERLRQSLTRAPAQVVSTENDTVLGHMLKMQNSKSDVQTIVQDIHTYLLNTIAKMEADKLQRITELENEIKEKNEQLSQRYHKESMLQQRIANLECELHDIKMRPTQSHAGSSCESAMDVPEGLTWMCLYCAPIQDKHEGKYLGNHQFLKDRLKKDIAEDDCLNIQHVYQTQILALTEGKCCGGQVERFPGSTTKFQKAHKVVYEGHRSDGAIQELFEKDIVNVSGRVKAKATKT